MKFKYFIIIFFIQNAHASFFGYNTFAECSNDKEAEYIDKGSSAIDGFSRAYAYCDKKFPILSPEYKSVSDITGKWRRINYLPNNSYEIVLNEACENVSFMATMKNGKNEIFTNISTSNDEKTRVTFEVPSPTIKLTITEATININHNLRKGDTKKIRKYKPKSISKEIVCNCSYQKCITFNEVKLKNGNIQRSEIELTGISGIKNFTHDIHGEKHMIMLYLEEAICISGNMFTPFDKPQPENIVVPNVSQIQLITHGDQAEQYSGNNKGDKFLIKGKVDYGISAYHLTPLLIDVSTMHKIN